MIELKTEFVELIRTLHYNGFMFNPILHDEKYFITEQELKNFEPSPYYNAILNTIKHD